MEAAERCFGRCWHSAQECGLGGQTCLFPPAAPFARPAVTYSRTHTARPHAMGSISQTYLARSLSLFRKHEVLIKSSAMCPWACRTQDGGQGPLGRVRK